MRMISQTLDMGGTHVVAIGNIPSMGWFQGHPNGKSRLKVKFPNHLRARIFNFSGPQSLQNTAGTVNEFM